MHWKSRDIRKNRSEFQIHHHMTLWKFEKLLTHKINIHLNFLVFQELIEKVDTGIFSELDLVTQYFYSGNIVCPGEVI